MIVIHFWSGMIAWLVVIYWLADLAFNDRWPRENTYFSKTIVVKKKDKEWDK